MSRVALLAYYFAPLGGAGVQRATKLAEQLGEHGWEPTVVAGPASLGGRWTPRDETLSRSGIRVVRVPGPEPAILGDRRGERWLRRPSQWTRWWREGARRAIASLDVDVVLATLSPFEGATAALDGAAALGVPCVLDLRDPWALDEMFIYPTRLHRALEQRAMRRALVRADAVIVNTLEAKQVAASLWPELAGRLSVVPNGFDPDDLDVEPETRDDDALRIVHTGYLHTALVQRGVRPALRRLAGGTLDGVDVGARSHRYLIEAIDRLRTERTDAARIELQLAGVLSADDALGAARPYVRVRGYLPHRESVALAKSADLLFLPMHDLPAGRRARIVPGKTYEYLATGRPILAAVPEGDARDLLTRAGTALLTRPRDVDGMAAVLRRALDGDLPQTAPARSVLAPYDRRAVAAAVAAVLDSVASPQARAAAAA